jgi:hypothetical protein
MNGSVYVRKIDELELSVRAFNALKANNITTVGELIKMDRNDLWRTPNLGKITFKEIEDVLSHLGLHLGMGMPQCSFCRREPLAMVKWHQRANGAVICRDCVIKLYSNDGPWETIADEA